jgi:hypothetical protein
MVTDGLAQLPKRALVRIATMRALATLGASTLAFGTVALLGVAQSSGNTLAGTARVVGAIQGARVLSNLYGTTYQSNNWAGYQKAGLVPGNFHQISATWVVPAASQAVAGQSEASATWVGIGGGCVQNLDLLVARTCVVDQTLIQAGSEQDVGSSGQASYHSWYEVLPEPETSISLPVRAGDVVSVHITEGLPATWTIAITGISASGPKTDTISLV